MSRSASSGLQEAIEALLAADEGRLPALAARHAALGLPLAEALRTAYFDSYGSDTGRAAAAERALAALAAAGDDREIGALAAWISGLAALQLAGRAEQAIQLIDAAAAGLAALGRAHDAAATQVSKVFALALLGRNDEAIACGLEARRTLLALGDPLSAGRVELNLGNLAFRRDQYDQAEAFYRTARERFAAADERRMLVAVDNGLANVLSLRLQIPAAAALYEQALAGAEALGLAATQADIECNLGVLALFQGRFDEALAYLERSRRRYAALARPHESAVSELELAEAYTELNLPAEAAAIYARVSATFAALEMRAEQARALLNHGRACAELGSPEEAAALLDEARTLFNAQGNAVGVALVTLAEAQIAYMAGDQAAVAAAAGRAAPALATAGALREATLARWLAADAARALGRPDAGPALQAALLEAEGAGALRVVQRCHTSLARLALAHGDYPAAEAALRRAVDAAEAVRAPIPADEIRAAFARETLAPYAELARLCLDDPQGSRVDEALIFAEAGRARALLDMLGGTPRLPAVANTPVASADLARLHELRAELNWLYSRLARPLDPDESPAARAIQHEAALQRERELAELRRRLAPGTVYGAPPPLDLAALRAALGATTALVAYADLAGELVGFVVTDHGVSVARGLGSPQLVEAALARLRFQIGAFTHGATGVRAHLPTLAERARRHLATLYAMLLRPLEALIDDRRIVVAPQGALHYVPFHALHDGAAYLVERREICYTPSAGVLLHCLGRPNTPVRTAVVVGVADEHAPRVHDEAAELATLFSPATLLLDQEATIAALQAAGPAADVLHLACHGRFRADNPLFSALRLGDGWLTVHEIYGLDLHCQLVTLSACETGVSAVAPGDELLGLTRGFFAAGTPNLCVSLWPVDDATTAELMAGFYAGMLAGKRPAAALRAAQIEALKQYSHPFFWASFILYGRW